MRQGVRGGRPIQEVDVIAISETKPRPTRKVRDSFHPDHVGVEVTARRKELIGNLHGRVLEADGSHGEMVREAVRVGSATMRG